jgi:hypothetical protein
MVAEIIEEFFLQLGVVQVFQDNKQHNTGQYWLDCWC